MLEAPYPLLIFAPNVVRLVPVWVRVTFLLLIFTAGSSGQAHAQDHDTPLWSLQSAAHSCENGSSLDAQVLRAVYHEEAPIVRGLMRGADRSAFPVFYGAPVAAWGGAWLVRGGKDWTDAYRLTGTQVATYGVVKGLKQMVQRQRPYWTLPGIRSRAPRYSPSGAEGASFSFPSGHASMAFAIATSWSLSHPRWYVIGPGGVWASSVALSRVWLGVHYPSDVLVGAALGAALAVGIHLLGPVITPDVLEGDDTEAPPPMMHVQFRF